MTVIRGRALSPSISGSHHEHDPWAVPQPKHGKVSTAEAVAGYIAVLGAKSDLTADIGGHLLKMPPNSTA